MKTRTKKLLLLGTSTALTLGFMEIVLQLALKQPWDRPARPDEPAIHQYDAELGWTNKAGKYSQTWNEQEIDLTFLETANRVTSHEQASGVSDVRPKVMLVGGSFTQGWAISDSDTFAWKIQKELPDFEILNFGTGGYGTLQSLMSMERYLPKYPVTKLVIYGLIAHHEERNVASASWLTALANFSDRGHVEVPYVTSQEDESLTRHPPTTFTQLPLRNYSALVYTTQRAYLSLLTKKREASARQVTKKLLLEMRDTAQEKQVNFAVAILDMPDSVRQDYLSFAKEHNLAIIDLAVQMGPELVVRGDGHPNGKLTTQWAKKLVEFIPAQLAE